MAESADLLEAVSSLIKMVQQRRSYTLDADETDASIHVLNSVVNDICDYVSDGQ